MIRPPGVIGRSAVDVSLGGECCKFGCGDLVIDPPTSVVVVGATSIGPPRIRTGTFAAERACYIDPTERVEPVIEMGTFFGKETGTSEIPFPVLEIILAMSNVEIAGQKHESITGS